MHSEKEKVYRGYTFLTKSKGWWVSAGSMIAMITLAAMVLWIGVFVVAITAWQSGFIDKHGMIEFLMFVFKVIMAGGSAIAALLLAFAWWAYQ